MIKIYHNDIEEIYSITVTGSMGMLWSNSFSALDTYSHKKKYFLKILKYFIRKGKLRLAKNGFFLTGTIQEQIDLFRESFPDEERMKEVEHYWWYLDECPAGAVWIVDEPVEGFTTPAENGKHYFWA